jgi:hypothetical protein
MPSLFARCRQAPWTAALLVTAASAQAGPGVRPVADTPATPELVRQLASDDPRVVAWAAYRAGDARRQDAVPALVDTLASPRLAAANHEWGAARDVVLDALIRLEARPPADVLTRHYDARSEQVLILLAGPGAGRNRALLGILKDESGILWHAAAGLLLDDKAAGLAASLLGGLRLTLEVTVVDGFAGDSLLDGGHTGGIGCGVMYPGAGFPPIATYSFWTTAEGGAIVLTGGPRPIFYTRQVCKAGTGIPSGGHRPLIDGPTADDRLALLKELLDHRLPVEAVRTLEVRWTNERQYLRDVSAAWARLARDVDKLVQLALDEGHLTADDARHILPAIDVRVRDARGRKRHPLPPIVP